MLSEAKHLLFLVSSFVSAEVFQRSFGHPRDDSLPRLAGYADTTRGSVVRREPIAARTKLFPSSHIGPGNLRHSVSTSSSALTNMSTSFSPMISGGRIFRTSIP